MAKSTLLQDFKAFAVKGNAIDMAVGVIIGGAFGKIVGQKFGRNQRTQTVFAIGLHHACGGEYAGAGKVAQSADVVGVQVRDDDRADVV